MSLKMMVKIVMTFRMKVIQFSCYFCYVFFTIVYHKLIYALNALMHIRTPINDACAFRADLSAI